MLRSLVGSEMCIRDSPRMHGTWRLSTQMISVGVWWPLRCTSAFRMSRMQRGSPLAGLKSRFLFICLIDSSLSGLSSSLLHKVTDEPVSSSAFTIFPPTEMFTIGLLSPEYRIEVRRLKQVSKHWGRFLLNTFPRDRFPTPGVLGSHIHFHSLHIHRRNPIPCLHTPCPTDL